jgi:gamma-glutamyltranspeptidase/glutathione hydrolase
MKPKKPPLAFVIVAALGLGLCLFGCASNIVLGRVVTSENGVVVCVDDLAAQVGAQVLEEGGNAVDAAVAVGFALAVTHPQAGNLGGGGFMVLRQSDGTLACIDYREKAPAASTPDMFLKEDGSVDKERRDFGFLASGVPGTVAGLELAHRRYGRLPWRRLVAPAIALAKRGFPVDADLARAFDRHEKNLKRFDTTVAAYFGKNGSPPEPGDRLTLPDLAETLTRIRDRGAAGFYSGRTAQELIDAVLAGGGIMTLKDLTSYQAKERQPVTGEFRGLTVVGMPLPSSGGTVLIEMLNILAGFDLKETDPALRLHILAETMRRAYRDRAFYLGDPDFVDAPLDRLLSAEHAAALRGEIDLSAATKSQALAEGIPIQTTKETSPTPGGREQEIQTTHFSIMDAEGCMVANTYTLERTFGCKAVAGTTGVLMNNEMHDFNVRPGWTADDGAIGTVPNQIAPGKRMLSSMCPVILMRGETPVAVLGSPGGRTIINTVLQVIVNLAELGQSPEDAVAAPRIHHQWFPDRICVEKTLPNAIREELVSKGHRIKEIASQGDCHIVVFDPETGAATGVADRRLDGWAAAVR